VKDIGCKDRQDRPVKPYQGDAEIEKKKRQYNALHPDELDAFKNTAQIDSPAHSFRHSGSAHRDNCYGRWNQHGIGDEIGRR
jgi:hypothetical protein